MLWLWCDLDRNERWGLLDGRLLDCSCNQNRKQTTYMSNNILVNMFKSVRNALDSCLFQFLFFFSFLSQKHKILV